MEILDIHDVPKICGGCDEDCPLEASENAVELGYPFVSAYAEEMMKVLIESIVEDLI
jgi:hypothetical protein